MARVENWATALTKHINDNRERPFKMGEHDCTMFVASAVYAVTGVDHAKGLRGTYSTPEGAFKKLLKVHGVDNLKAMFDAKFPEVHIAYARPGDIVYQRSNYLGFNVVVGICYGMHSFFVSEDENRLVEVPTLSLDGAWHVK